MNVDIEITSVRILVNAFLVYGHCIYSNKRRSIFIKKQSVFKEPLIAEVWQFNCSSTSKFINFIPQYTSTEGMLTLTGLASVDNELALFERTGKPCSLPFLTNRLFLKHPKFRGIGCGQERIKKAIKEAGSARQFLTELKNNNLAALVDAFNSQQRAIAFLKAYNDIKAEFESIEFIEKAGYDKRTSHKLIKLFGNNTKEQLLQNPYSPIRLGSQFTNAWGVAERLVKNKLVKLGCDSSQRLIGAVDVVVYRELKNNHTAIPDKEFRIKLSNLVGNQLVDTAITKAMQSLALCKTYQGHYQGVGLAYLESNVEKSLADKITRDRNANFHEVIARYIDDFDSIFARMKGYHLTSEQKSLAFKTLTKNLSIAQGAGGTGKSTAMACVKHVCNKLNRPVYFVAVAGIAKKRVNNELVNSCVIRSIPTGMMGETEDEVCTYTVRGLIAQIKLSIENPNIRHAILLDKDPLVVFDESSMLDLSLIAECLNILDKNTKSYSVGMVGDVAQIAPVGFGVVWQHLVRLGIKNTNTVPYSELKSVHRQGSDNPIRDVSTLIRKVGHTSKTSWSDETQSFANNPLSFMSKLNLNTAINKGVYYSPAIEMDINSIAYECASKLGMDKTQIITPYSAKDNALSTSSVNEFFIEKIRDDAAEKLWGYCKGDHVIVGSNYALLDIYNGDMAIVDSIVHAYDEHKQLTKRLVCKFADKTVTLDEAAVFDTKLRHAYGITIHKTQGSEFDYTVVIVPKTANIKFVENSLIYTALTRSKIATIFIGDMNTLKQAINSSPAYKNITTGFCLEAELDSLSKIN